MPCNPCETAFRSAQPVLVTISKSGSTAHVYVQNQGRNIVHLRRMFLCYSSGVGYGGMWLRPGGPGWGGPEYLEQGINFLYHTFTPPTGYRVEAQVEYVEIDGRSRSCPEQF